MANKKQIAIEKQVEVKNKKAEFEYFLTTRYEAGIVLLGTEIKAIKEGKANLLDAFCAFRKNELFVIGMHIGKFSKGTHFTHDPFKVRKLLLNKRELKKIQAKVRQKGNTIIPVRLFISERGYAKLEISLAQGKKKYDKRNSIKEKDQRRERERGYKY